MPKCERCAKSVRSFELKRVVGEDGKSLVVCAACRVPREVVSDHPSDRQIASLALYQYETEDGRQDYQVRIVAEHANLSLAWQFTFDDVRKLFGSEESQ